MHTLNVVYGILQFYSLSVVYMKQVVGKNIFREGISREKKIPLGFAPIPLGGVQRPLILAVFPNAVLVSTDIVSFSITHKLLPKKFHALMK